jgi:putative nucleotidyltransferase with HDIG domain
VITDPQELQELHRSHVPSVWIDVSRGRDVVAQPDTVTSEAEQPPAGAVQAQPTPTVNAASSPVPAHPQPPRQASAPSPVSFEQEFERAAQVLHQARQVVTTVFNEARLGKVVGTDELIPLVEDVAGSLARNPGAFVSLARLKTKDDYTYMHSVAVCALMVGLARELGQDAEQVRLAGLAGLLHDVGKMAMPHEVLNKPGSLTDDEFAIMRSHPRRGFELLKEGHGVPQEALDVCLHHHEKMDGSGYPDRLKGEEISVLARMGAVCDVYDAITSTRPYKTAWDPAGSIQRMSQWVGHFDPAIFAAFVKSVGIYPTGSLVRLTSGRLAVVVDQNPSTLVAPRVKVFFSTKSGMPIPVAMLDLAAAGTSDRIEGRESPRKWGFTHLEQLWNPNAP